MERYAHTFLFLILGVLLSFNGNADGPRPPFAATKLTITGNDEFRIPLTKCLSKELRASDFVSVVDDEYHWWIDIITMKGKNRTVIISSNINKVDLVHFYIDLASKYYTPPLDPVYIKTLKATTPEFAVTNQSHALKEMPVGELSTFCLQFANEFHVKFIEPNIRAYQKLTN